ncbi:MAG: S49 family peptidase [Desulfurellales bacterium]|nr:MAG: S49 family peptidase [Desulfurellales bacterium]
MNLLSYMTGVWCISEEAMVAMRDIRVDAGAVQVGPDAGSPKVTRRKNIAVIPLHGVMEHRLSMIGYLMGGTSTLAFGHAMDAAVADPNIGGILVSIDSPGGSSFGVQEVAAKIRAARGTKPMVAVADPMAASGAYWLASQFDRFYVSPSSGAGSVGAYRMHQNVSEQLAKEGVSVEIIRADASPEKVSMNDVEPLTDAARTHAKSQLNQVLDQFIADISAGRGIPDATVRETFGKGRVLLAKEAVAVGMADRVATIEEVAQRLVDGRIRMVRQDSRTSLVEAWDGGPTADTVRRRVEALKAVC